MHTEKLVVQSTRTEYVEEVLNIKKNKDGVYYFFIESYDSPYPRNLIKLVKNHKSYRILIVRFYGNDNDVQAHTFNIHLMTDCIHKDGMFVLPFNKDNHLKSDAQKILNHFILGKNSKGVSEIKEDLFMEKIIDLF